MGKQRFNLFPINPKRFPFFYGWVIIFAGTIGILVSAPGQTMGVSTFTDHLLEAIGISRDQLSTAYMIGTILSSFALTFAGKMYDKYGARWVGMIAAMLLAAVLVLLSQVDRIIKNIATDNGSTTFVMVAIIVLISLFFFLRFSGQGVLTMVSRNMMMKWFVAKRGLVNGLSSVFVAFGFSMAPLSFDWLIQEFTWRGAWLLMAACIGLLMALFIFIFFRDNPEDLGLDPDGEEHKNVEHNVVIKPVKQYSLKDARHNYSFWIFAIPLSIYTMSITGFTFHIFSIFEEAGLTRESALAIFIPTSLVSVVISMSGGWLSDRIKLKYLLIVMVVAELIALWSLANFSGGIYYYLLILGNGVTGGLFNVLIAVTWPRFYGRINLGAISGFVMSIIVFASALGPIFLSLSLSQTGTYSYAFYLIFALAAIFFIGSFRADNPQDKLVSED